MHRGRGTAAPSVVTCDVLVPKGCIAIEGLVSEADATHRLVLNNYHQMRFASTVDKILFVL